MLLFWSGMVIGYLFSRIIASKYHNLEQSELIY